MPVQFDDFSMKVKEALEEAAVPAEKFLAV